MGQRAGCRRVRQEAPLHHFEQHVTANGASLWTATEGNGPPIVICHGGPGLYDYLEPVAAMVDDLATVHRYDQRGCGRSEDAPPYDIATFVADLEALRRHWGYDSWTVMGHSWGADLALIYALRHQERVTRLVYLSGTGIDPAWHAEYRRNRAAKLSPGDRERLRRLDERRAIASETDLARINHERSALLARTEYFDMTQLKQMPRYDRFPVNYTLNATLSAEAKRLEESGELRAQAAELKVPTLVLDGEADPRPRWARAELAELLPNGRHVSIPRAGHEPWIEQPEATRQALREFLTAND